MSNFDGKKRKRAESRVFRFKTFGENGHPVEFNGAFRHNVEALLEFGQVERKLCNGMASWSFQLEVHRHPAFHILLFVVEEPAGASMDHQCKHCRYVGWGHHMVCNNKYHFILPSESMGVAYLNCQGNEYYDTASNLMESQGHAMHGVLHSNGFGHLLCVNGVETGSDLTGHRIMDFWDRLCTGLQARKVSLYDNSRKKGMELRLLHVVAYGQPWFGHWGYKFGRGSFGVTQPTYQKAIEAIQGMPLCLLLHHLGHSNQDIPLIFSRYQTLSDHSLATLGDLFHFLLDLKSRLPKENGDFGSYNPGILVETNCRWSAKRVEMATRVIVEALKRSESKWVSRQQVRDVARSYIGDTGLLDFVLKSLGNHIVGKYLIRRSLNPVTKILEYCLEDISNTFTEQDLGLNNSQTKARYRISVAQLMKDVRILYKIILKDHKQVMSSGIFGGITMASRIILDTKYFVKECSGDQVFSNNKVELGLEGKFKLYCTIILRDDENPNARTENALQPYECVIVKNNATFDELKLEVQRNFRELYWGLRSFVVESVVNLNAIGTNLVFGLVEVGRKIAFEGSNRERGIVYGQIYENGMINCVVECVCGAEEDDGERMVSCDICEVRQHTRCVRIPNNQEIPHIFLCNRCEQEVVHLSSLQ